MAKNIHDRKKRIAHYKNAFEENDLMGCHDFVSSIIEDMDSFTSTCFTNLPRGQQNDAPKISLPSTNQTQLQNSIVPKSKKFSLSKKFPLMEKTQKTLKQISHNRKMPKPRAHLSRMSPLRKRAIIRSSDKATEKLKRNNGNFLKNTSRSQNKNELPKPIHNEPKPCTSKSTITKTCKKDSKIVKSKCEVEDSSPSKDIADNSSDSEYENFIKKAKKDLPKKHRMQKTCSNKKKISKKSIKKCTEINNSSEAAKSVSDCNETIEYDSGVSDVASTSPVYGSQKKLKENLKVYEEMDVDYNESDFSDTTSASSLPYYRRSKRVKKCQENVKKFTDSNFNDTASTSSLPYYRRSKVKNSKEDLSNEIHTATDYDNEFEVGSYQGESYSRDSSSESDNDNENRLNNTCNEQCDDPKKENSLLSEMLSENANNGVPCFSITSSEYKPLGISQNDINCSTSSLHQTNAPILDSSVVDLTESDNEYDNATTGVSTTLPKGKDESTVATENLNETAQYSEESDLEIIDIVMAPTINTECNIERQSCESRLGFKTEKVDCLVKTEVQSLAPSVENCNTSEKDTNKFEATYITNICTENSKNISSPSVQPSTDKNIDGIEQSKEIKKEVCDDDDDVIIIDVTDPSPIHQSEMRSVSCNHNINNTNQVKVTDIPVDVKLPFSTISCKQLPNIKIGSDLNIKSQMKYPAILNDLKTDKISKTLAAEKELKLYEIACSNLKMQNQTEEVYIQDKEINSLGSVDPKILVQRLKKELETYERILQTEKSVGATFKLLESQQAEKLVSLKSMIGACLKSSNANCDNSKIIKNEMISLLDSPNVNRSTFTDKNQASSVIANAIISRDFKNIPSTEQQASFSNINLVPLSSISENDIKPNLSELQQKLDSSQKFMSEKTALTFGEKCIICGKGALAACQQCAKVFFCSNECGIKYWDDGHRNECTKRIAA